MECIKPLYIWELFRPQMKPPKYHLAYKYSPHVLYIFTEPILFEPGCILIYNYIIIFYHSILNMYTHGLYRYQNISEVGLF